MKVTIELPEEYAVESRKQTATIRLADIPEAKRAAFFAHAALHGLKQAIADAAAGSKAKAEAEESEVSVIEQTQIDMDSKIATLVTGEWSVRREAAAADPVGKRALQIALRWIKAEPKLWEIYRGADAEAKAELRTAVFEKYEDRLREDAKAEIAAEAKLEISVDDLLDG